MALGTCRDVELLRQRLHSLEEFDVKAILLFGSKARGNRGRRAMLICLCFIGAAGLKMLF